MRISVDAAPKDRPPCPRPLLLTPIDRTFLRSIPPDRGPDLASQQLGTPCVCCKSPSCGYYTIDDAGQQGKTAAECVEPSTCVFRLRRSGPRGGLFISRGYRVIDGAKKKWLSMHSLSGRSLKLCCFEWIPPGIPVWISGDIPFPLKTSLSAFSQDHTAATALALLKREQCCSCRRLEYVVDALSA